MPKVSKTDREKIKFQEKMLNKAKRDLKDGNLSDYHKSIKLVVKGYQKRIEKIRNAGYGNR